MSATKDHDIRQQEAAERGNEVWTASYVGPSGTKGGRYRVFTPDGKTRTIGYDHAARNAAQTAIEQVSGGTVVSIDRKEHGKFTYHVAEVKPAFNYGRAEMSDVMGSQDFAVKVRGSNGNETKWIHISPKGAAAIRDILIVETADL